MQSIAINQIEFDDDLVIVQNAFLSSTLNHFLPKLS